MSISDEALGVLLAIIVVLIGAPLAVMAAYLYYRGEDRAEREAARERESAVLREVAGAPNSDYLLALVWARWRGLTRRDRRVVQAVWLGWSLLCLVMVGISGSAFDTGDLVGALALFPLSLAAITLGLIFRMR